MKEFSDTTISLFYFKYRCIFFLKKIKNDEENGMWEQNVPVAPIMRVSKRKRAAIAATRMNHQRGAVSTCMTPAMVVLLVAQIDESGEKVIACSFFCRTFPRGKTRKIKSLFSRQNRPEKATTHSRTFSHASRNHHPASRPMWKPKYVHIILGVSESVI